VRVLDGLVVLVLDELGVVYVLLRAGLFVLEDPEEFEGAVALGEVLELLELFTDLSFEGEVCLGLVVLLLTEVPDERSLPERIVVDGSLELLLLEGDTRVDVRVFTPLLVLFSLRVPLVGLTLSSVLSRPFCPVTGARRTLSLLLLRTET